MLNADEIINKINNSMKDIDKFHVLKLALFGSFARGEQNYASDIDMLVEFEAGHETFDNYMDLKFFLEELFGRKVDLVIFNSIKPSLRHSIMRSVRYAKGA